MFDTTMRGYDRRQVDQRLEELVDEAEAERRRAEAERQRAEAAEAELAAAGQGERPGFGSLMEEMLRVAEARADELHAAAGQDGAKILEQAHLQAEAHQREAARSLAAARAHAAEQAQQLRRELDSHRAAMTDELAAAHSESDRIRSAAEADSAALIERARREAQDTHEGAEKAIAEQRERCHVELGRLRDARDGLWKELARLQEVLAGVVSEVCRKPDDEVAPDTQRTEPGAEYGIVAPRAPSDSATAPHRAPVAADATSGAGDHPGGGTAGWRGRADRG